MITSVVKNKLVKPNQKVEDFVDHLAAQLNTSMQTIYMSYDRSRDKEKHISTIDIVHKNLLEDNEGMINIKIYLILS
jgi:hypothetical protein